jgi:hypothetical protein
MSNFNREEEREESVCVRVTWETVSSLKIKFAAHFDRGDNEPLFQIITESSVLTITPRIELPFNFV